MAETLDSQASRLFSILNMTEQEKQSSSVWVHYAVCKNSIWAHVHCP